MRHFVFSKLLSDSVVECYSAAFGAFVRQTINSLVQLLSYSTTALKTYWQYKIYNDDASDVQGALYRRF